MALKLVLEKDKLLKAMSVLDMVPASPGIVPSEFIRLSSKKAGHLQMCLSSEISGQVSVSGKGKWSGEFYADRRLLTPFIMAAANINSKLPFKFRQLDKKTISITHGRRKAEFTNRPPIGGYGEVETLKTYADLAVDEATRTLITCARECAEEDISVPELNCVYLRPMKKGVMMYATTQKLVYRAYSSTKAHMKEPIAFPLFLVSLMGDEQLKEIEWRRREVVLQFSCGHLWQSVPSKARKHFPWQQIDKTFKASEKVKTSFVVSTKALGEIITRLSFYLSSVRRIDWVLTLTGKPGQKELLLESKVPSGVFREEVKTLKPITSEFTISWPFDKLLGILLLVSKKDTSLFVSLDENGRSYVRVGSLQLVIPRRIK